MLMLLSGLPIYLYLYLYLSTSLFDTGLRYEYCRLPREVRTYLYIYRAMDICLT